MHKFQTVQRTTTGNLEHDFEVENKDVLSTCLARERRRAEGKVRGNFWIWFKFRQENVTLQWHIPDGVCDIICNGDRRVQIALIHTL